MKPFIILNWEQNLVFKVEMQIFIIAHRNWYWDITHLASRWLSKTYDSRTHSLRDCQLRDTEHEH